MDTKFLDDLDPVARPRFRALADRICEAVSTGEIPAGQKLPPVRDLAWQLKMSPGAVARAYKLGVERGALEATVGRGTFARAETRLRFALDGLLDIAGPETIDLRGNQAVDVGQDAEIGRALQRLIDRHGGCPPLTGYRRREDDPEAIETLAGWLRDGGIPAEADRLLVTTGAQSGLFAAMSAISRGGEGVLLAPPTLYPGLRDGASALGIRIETVEVDDEGLIPEALDAACARVHPDAIQISATLQNPTLTIMGEARRRALTEIARRRDVAIIEDDVYGRLFEPALPSFAELAPERCWYITSLSKTVAAGVRGGLVLTPPGQTIPTLRFYQAFAQQTPWLVKALAAELVAGGEADAILARIRVETRDRAALAARLLAPYGARTHPAASFVYLPFAPPWTSGEFISAAAASGVLLPPPSIYQTGRGGPDFVRIALGARVDRPRLEEALRRLARLLQDGPTAALVTT